MRTFIALLFFSTLLQAQFVPGKYIVELAEPAAAVAVPAARASKAAALQQARQRIAASQNRLRADVESAGGRVLDTTSTVANTLMVEVSEAVAAQLAARPDVKRVHKVRIDRKSVV